MRRSRRDERARYFLIASIALFILAAGVLSFVVVKKQLASSGQTRPNDPARPPPTVASPASRPIIAPPPAVGTSAAAVPMTAAPPPQSPPAEVKPVSISSDALRQQHADNDSAAAQRFKDKKLSVTGTVATIFQEAPLIGIGFGTLQDSMPPVLCDMDAKQVNALAQLRPGQVITVEGIYLGKVQGGYIGLGACRVTAIERQSRP